MVLQTHPKLSRGPAPLPPELRVVQARRRRARVHLFTYLVGNALFWTLWAENVTRVFTAHGILGTFPTFPSARLRVGAAHSTGSQNTSRAERSRCENGKDRP